MRSFLGFAVVALAAMFQSAAPAAANWSCKGPEFVCGKSASAKAHTYKKVSAKHASKKAHHRNASYDAPVKAKKSKKVAYSSGGSMSGKASYYWQPQRVASGAHKTLPFGTKVRVTNRNNGKSVVVTINDRGPYVAGRIIDLSKAAAHAISMQGSGVVPVQVAVLGRG